MKSLMGIAILTLAGAAIIVGQDPRPDPRATPTPRLTAEIDRAIDDGKDISARSDSLRKAELFPVENDEERRAFRAAIEPLYRDSTKEERAALAPDEEVVEAYRAFLKGKNTGIIRLASDIGCVSQDDVVSGKEECRNYPMPGAGSSYSFREEDYRIVRLADINFKNSKFEALGVMTHGIMVDLGDKAIEGVTLKSDGAKHIAKISPASDFAEAGAFAAKLEKGYEKGAFTYASILPAKLNSTYVVRSIAYRGTAARTAAGVVYNELDLDRRRDAIFVFRVVSINEGKDVTLLWKELRDKKARKLKPPK